MSCAGSMRLRVYRETGEWISLCKARALAVEECSAGGGSFATELPGGGLPEGHEPVGDARPFSPPVNFMSLRGFTRYHIYATTGEWPTWEEVDAILEALAE